MSAKQFAEVLTSFERNAKAIVGLIYQADGCTTEIELKSLILAQIER